MQQLSSNQGNFNVAENVSATDWSHLSTTVDTMRQWKVVFLLFLLFFPSEKLKYVLLKQLPELMNASTRKA